MKSVVIFGAIILGFLCLIGSGLWTSLFPGTATWTAEKAERSAEVKARLAYLGGIIESPRRSMHSGPDPAQAKSEFDALKKENDQLNAEFNSAYDSPRTMSRVLKWTGISLAAVGLIGWYAIKNMNS